ncbi:hypothetical protein Bbelb_020700 [Branchiostoma belcheri]|nr:hypothetical protein Bbelb_020700 [Branchiostoma belcheri]
MATIGVDRKESYFEGLWANLPSTTRASTSIAIFKNELETFYHSPHTQPHFSHGPRNPATHLTRLRLNRSQLNFYLFQHQCVPSTACKCGHSNETAVHYFLHCPQYTDKRTDMLSSLTNILPFNTNNVTDNT